MEEQNPAGTVQNIPETLKEASEEFLVYLSSVRDLSVNSVTGYTEDFKHLLSIAGENTKIKDVTVEDLRGCIGTLSRQKYSAASVNRFIAAVRGLFAYCKRFKYIDINPASELKTVKLPKHLPRFMTENEVDGLCREAGESDMLWPARDKALFEMLYSSGCRVSEMASLSFSQMTSDFSSAMITGKGRKDRRVYFEEDARNALNDYLSERKLRFPQTMQGGGKPVDQIFINQRGTPLSTKGIWFIVSKYSQSGDKKLSISPHSFRHTFATAMLQEGADIRYVQAMLGHSSLSTTQRYTHLTKEQLKQIYAQAHPHSGKED